MSDSTWGALALLLAGAVISLGSTSLTDWAKEARARRRENTERTDAQAEALQQTARTHTRQVFDLLNELWAMVRDSGGELNPADEARRTQISTEIHNTYLLIPDEAVRQVVRYAMFGMANYRRLDDLATRRTRAPQYEYIEILTVARTSLAGYIRGDGAIASDIQYLVSVREHVNARLGLT